jgi:nitrilase
VVCDSSDPSIGAIQHACREAAVTISLGVSERMPGGYTLFNSQVHIDSHGGIIGVHRKLQPTYAERYVWAQGDGSTLRVWPVDVGHEHEHEHDGRGTRGTRGTYNLGGLCCWENTLNGARQALIQQDQHVHVGAWPSLSTMSGFEGVADAQIEALMKAHALTAQVFVLCASSPVDDTCLDWMDRNLGKQELVTKGGGWTAIIHPFCPFLAGPHAGGHQRLVVADLDFNDLGQVKVWIDGNGHYKRPEVLEMQVNTKQLWPLPLAESAENHDAEA